MINPRKKPIIHYTPPVKPPPPEPETPDVKHELAKEVLSWAKTIIFVILFAMFFNSFIIVNARVPTPSMEDTIITGDRIVAFRLSYLFREPRRYEMIVFRGPEGDPTLYVKRILGLPGESLIIIDGHVYINGSSVPQRYEFVKGNIRGNFGIINAATGQLEPYTIPEGHVFVLGDYRDRSEDSRGWSEIYIPHSRILGRVVFRYFPGFANLTNR
ncbi:MAG: signal peptidase I [Defluviitaleaceae bacterium]|nr:signal peptidase I [Defluviitaleaceae bacterium]